MNARSAMEDPDSPVPMEQPRLVPPPIPRASEERVEAAPPVMLPTPRARAGAASKSGLAAMLPSSAHKLRVRLERDGKDALFIADFPESIVMSYGSVEQFLLAQPIRRVPAEDLRSDTLRFRVCIIEPTRGAEGQVNVYDVAVPPELRCVVQPQPQVQPALPQVQQAQQPFNPATLLDSVQEISDRDREKAEELIEKLSAKLRQPQPMQRPPWQPPQPRMPPLQASGSVAIDRIGDAVNKLTNIVLETNERMSRYEQGSREQARSAQLGQMQQPAQSAPLNDMLLPLLMKLLDRQLTPAPAPSESSHLETLKELMALARPQHIETDTSELEGYIEKLEKKIEDNNPMKMLGQLKEYKELFRPGGLLSNEGDRQSSGLLGGLRDLLGMVFDNTEKIEKIAAGVINSMAEAKVQAIRQTMSSMPQRQLAPAASPRVEAPVAPVVQQRPAMPLTTPVDPVTEPQRAEGAPAGEVMPTTPPKELPKEINDKIVELLTSTSPTLMVVLVYDLMELMGKFQPTEIVVEKVMGYLQDNKLPNLVIYLRDVFKILGYGEVATATRIQAIVDAIKAQIEAARAADAPAAAPATTPTAGTGPIEVGDEDIEESEPSDSGIDGEDEQEGDDDDDSSDGEDDDSDGEDEPDVKGKGAPIVIHTAGKQEPEVADG